MLPAPEQLGHGHNIYLAPEHRWPRAKACRGSRLHPALRWSRDLHNPVSPLAAVDTYDQGSSGNGHFLDLGEAAELSRDISRVHVAFV